MLLSLKDRDTEFEKGDFPLNNTSYGGSLSLLVHIDVDVLCALFDSSKLIDDTSKF